MPAIPIAESRAPIVVGISATSSAIRVTIEASVSEKLGEWAQRHDDGEEDERQPGEQDVEGDLVRRLAPLGPLDQVDHPVEEALAGLLGDLDHDPVREHPRAAGDGAAVAARLAHHRGRLAGDRRLVDRGDPLDHRAVAGDHLARLDHDHVAAAQLGRRLLGPVAQVRDGLGPHRAQRVGLRLAAPLGQRLGEVGEDDGQPEPGGDREGEPGGLAAAAERRAAEELDQPAERWRSRRRPRPRTSPGCASWWRGSSLRSESSPARGEDRPRRTGSAARCEAARRSLPPLLVERQIQLQDVDARLAEEVRGRGLRCCRAIRSSTARSGSPRTAATRWAWMRALASEMCGSTPEAEVVTASTGTSAAVSARVVRPLAPQVGAQVARPATSAQLGAVGAEVVEGGGVGGVAGRPRARLWK